ncbi:MAG: ISL3 family transposase, partial [Gemmatimonadota bacterium]
MDDRRLYQTILGLTEPWYVSEVEVRAEAEEVVVRLALPADAPLSCPACGRVAPRYDRSDERRWRHLDTCQYQTLLVARVPRVRCEEHGVRQIAVAWAEDRSRFTALFEALAIRLLQETTVSGLAALMGLSWDEAAAIQRRAVARGLSRRAAEPLRFVGVDETSFAKRHEYVTVVADLERSRVVWVGDHRRRHTLGEYWSTVPEAERARVEEVVMDMWDPYIAATRVALPAGAEKIVFDRFHVVQHLNQAVDQVRRAEQRELHQRGDRRLKKTRYLWLKGRQRRTPGLGSQGGPCMGPQGGGLEAVGLRLPRLGTTLLPEMVLLGHPLPAPSHDPCGPHDEALPAGDRRLPAASPHQRLDRSPQLKDPGDQVPRTRLPQPRQLPARHPVPLRKTRHEPTLNPEEP